MERKPDSWYEQSAVLAHRTEGGEEELVLVTSMSRKRWVIPKGIVEPGMEPADSAAKEALEEAGVIGTLDRKEVGEYRYRKWSGLCRVKVYLLKIDKVLKEWPESPVRERVFVSPEEAMERVTEPELKAMIARVFLSG